MPRLVFYPKKRSLFAQKRFFTIKNEKCPALCSTPIDKCKVPVIGKQDARIALGYFGAPFSALSSPASPASPALPFLNWRPTLQLIGSYGKASMSYDRIMLFATPRSVMMVKLFSPYSSVNYHFEC